MLEYACGPGHISLVSYLEAVVSDLTFQALAPFVTRLVGVDLSDGMLDEFNKNVREAGRSDTVVGIKANLLADESPAGLSAPEYFDFDLLVVSMALHHFEYPEQALNRLGQRLKKGGVIMVLDMIPESDPHFGQDHARHQMGEVVETISKHGFTVEEMHKMYEDAGAGNGFKYRILEEPLEFTKNGNSFRKTIFIARGQK